MVKAAAELVTFTQGALAAQMTARAEADAVGKFDLRRGLQLSAEARAELEASLTATLGGHPEGASAVATLTAGLGASARLALAAQLDVNGLFAEACGAAEARVAVRGDISVKGQALLDALDTHDAKLAPHVLAPVSPGVLAPITAFLQEVQVHAGVYAEAYFALRARARMMVTGTIIPGRREHQAAGLTVKFDYGYAYIWGAGVSGYVDVDLPDAPHVVGVVVETAIAEMLRLLPSSTPPQIQSLLRLVMPLAASSALAIGQALGAPQSGEQTSGADEIGNIADAFLGELRTQGLDMVVTVILDETLRQANDLLTNILDDPLQADQWQRLDAAMQRGLEALTQVDDLTTVQDALQLLINTCDALAAVSDDSAGDLTVPFARAATVAAGAAAIAMSLLGHDPLPSFPDALAVRVMNKLHGPRPSRARPTIVELVEYLGQELEGLEPEAPHPLDWLASILGSSAPSLLGLLWELGSAPSDPAARRQLAADAVTGVVDQLTVQLRPFLNQLPDGELKDLAAFVEPLMEAVELSLLPLLTAPDNLDTSRAARVRDELDALLTGMFGAVVVRCLNTIIRPFFARGAAQLRELADRVDHQSPEFQRFFELANEYDVVFRISEAIVSASLRETADILEVAERSAFNSAVELMEVFVLLPPEDAERRAQLAELAGSDNPRIGDDALRTQLLDALFVKSTEFAVAMIPPSIRMSSLIAAEQGPIPIGTLFNEVKTIGEASVETIQDLAAVGATIGGIISRLLDDGRINADALKELGDGLKELIKDATDIADDVLELIKEFSWPIYVTSTGGLALVIPAVRDAFYVFFDGADWLLDEIHLSLDRLTNALVEAAIAVAQDLGVLDTGEGDDLGTLGMAVRQQVLGDPDQPGLTLFEGAVTVRHSELASMVTNAAFEQPEIRSKIRSFHAGAAEQAKTSQRALLLRSQGEEAAKAETALRQTLAAQQRDTGFQFRIEILGVEQGATYSSGVPLEVAITGAGIQFVNGSHAQVKVEIGGWPAEIDPRGWHVDAGGKLRGKFWVIADPDLGAPHPLVATSAVSVPANLRGACDGDGTTSPELAAFRMVRENTFARSRTAGNRNTLEFLSRPFTTASPSTAVDFAASDFVPPSLLAAHAPLPSRFPATLVLDRQAVLAETTDASVRKRVENLPGTPETAFVSSTELSSLGLDEPLAIVTNRSIGAAARPGYTIVTATVAAVPKVGQDRDTTPSNSAEPLWFNLRPPEPATTPPEPVHNDATFVPGEAVPDAISPFSPAQVSITMLNTGLTTWTAEKGYKLGAQPGGTEIWGSAFVELPHDVAPQAQVTFTFSINAPPLGGATFKWQMVREEQGEPRSVWFGEETPASHIDRASNAAEYRSQVVPESIPAAGVAPVSVTMRNVGSTTWTSGGGYMLGSLSPVDNTTWGSHRQKLPHDVLPPGAAFPLGQEVVFNFRIPAPPPPSRPFQWRMLQEGKEWFGTASDAKTIKVVQPRVTGIAPVLFMQETPAHIVDAAISGFGLRGATVQFPVPMQILDNNADGQLRLRVTVPAGPPQPPQPENERPIVWIKKRRIENFGFTVTTAGGLKLSGTCQIDKFDWQEKGRGGIDID